ncbi:3478_t:CDS:2, partial [Racocetra fulgida]
MLELTDQLSSLTTYIIYQMHYNQIVANDYYNLATMSYTNQDNVAMSYNDLMIEHNQARRLLEVAQIEKQQM